MTKKPHLFISTLQEESKTFPSGLFVASVNDRSSESPSNGAPSS